MNERFFEWIENGCNFEEGVSLLASISKNKQLARIMAGREARYADKLMYELCKASGLEISDYQKFAKYAEQLKEIESSNPDAEETDPTGPAADDPETPASDKKLPGYPDKQLPEDVERVIKEHADLFKLRAQLHEQLAGLPGDNESETVKKRKNIIDSIAFMSFRIDRLFEAKEAFYTNNEMPNMAIIFPEPKPEPEPVDDLPDDIAELKKRKKNFQSANTKDLNQLEFQSDKKGEKPSQMPAGPKRLKLETRIADRIAEIEKIDFKLLELDRTNA